MGTVPIHLLTRVHADRLVARESASTACGHICSGHVPVDSTSQQAHAHTEPRQTLCKLQPTWLEAAEIGLLDMETQGQRRKC